MCKSVQQKLGHSKTGTFNDYVVEMGSSWNFPARASPSYEDSEPSRAGAIQFSIWNRADNNDNIYVKK